MKKTLKAQIKELEKNVEYYRNKVFSFEEKVKEIEKIHKEIREADGQYIRNLQLEIKWLRELIQMITIPSETFKSFNQNKNNV